MAASRVCDGPTGAAPIPFWPIRLFADGVEVDRSNRRRPAAAELGGRVRQHRFAAAVRLPALVIFVALYARDDGASRVCDGPTGPAPIPFWPIRLFADGVEVDRSNRRRPAAAELGGRIREHPVRRSETAALVILVALYARAEWSEQG